LIYVLFWCIGVCVGGLICVLCEIGEFGELIYVLAWCIGVCVGELIYGICEIGDEFGVLYEQIS
jgi:hypothetical protein